MILALKKDKYIITNHYFYLFSWASFDDFSEISGTNEGVGRAFLDALALLIL